MPRIKLRSDPGLEVPEELFESGLDETLDFLGRALKAEAEKREKEKDRKKAEPGEAADSQTERERPARNPLGEAFGELPPAASEPPEVVARRLRHGAATTARRAMAVEGRREMARATQAVLAAPETPAVELPSRLKAEAGQALKQGLAEAQRAGLAAEELARLEADLGAQELVLLERGLAEQAARLQAQTEAQLETEASELVEAVRRDPGLAASAAPALAELLADFAPGFREGALEGFGIAARRRLAAAEVEGLLARGDLEGAEAALARSPDLPETARRRLEQETAAQRARRPREDQALAAAIRSQLIAETESGRPADPQRLREIAILGGPDALEGLEAELRRAAERRRVALRLAALPPQAWAETLRDEGLDPTGLHLVTEAPGDLRAPRPAQAPQLAQAGGDDGGGAGEASGLETFRRRPGESDNDWVLRLQEELRAAEDAAARLPIYEAYLRELAEDPAAQRALAQRVGPEAHLTARPAPDHIQSDYDAALERGDLRPDEGLPIALSLYFLGPDGKLYQRGTEQDDSLLPAFAEQIELWMAQDEVGQEDETRQTLQLLLEELGQSLLARGRLRPTRRPGIVGGSQDDDGKGDAEGSGRGGGGTPSGQDDGSGSAQTDEQAGTRKTLRLKKEVEDPAPPEVQRKPAAETPSPPPDIPTLIERRVISEPRAARQQPEAQVHTVHGQEDLVFPEQSTRVFVGPDRSIRDNAGRTIDVATPMAADVLRTGRPLGMSDATTFDRFKEILIDHRADLPADARFGIRGSAITGDGFDDTVKRYSKGYFDIDRKSDWDLAVVSPSLLESARGLGIELRQGGTRTVRLGERDLMKLGLTEFAEEIKGFPGRGKSEIMIYGSQEALNRRGPNMIFDLKSQGR